jgi:hypothetical protein
VFRKSKENEGMEVFAQQNPSPYVGDYTSKIPFQTPEYAAISRRSGLVLIIVCPCP